MKKLISICIITYKRPQGLIKLLDSLFICLRHSSYLNVTEIIVVDNDIERTGYKAIQEQKSRLRIKYLIEKRKGIPFARNAAIRASSSESLYILFVDDDEVVSKQWLENIFNTQSKYDADVVAGPVIPIFETNPSRWIIKGKFFELRKPKKANGDKIYEAQTSNVLIRKNIFYQENVWFDETLIDTGGTDTLLFKKILQKGYKMYWAEEAYVREHIPASRANMRWLLKRSYRHGITLSISSLRTGIGIKPYFSQLLKGCYRIILGVIYLPITPLGKEYYVIGLRNIYRGLGNIVALFGVRYNEYNIIHRSTV